MFNLPVAERCGVFPVIHVLAMFYAEFHHEYIPHKGKTVKN